MTGADVAGLVVLGVVVAGGIAYVVMQKNKTAPANFGPYVQQPGASTYSAPPLVSAQPPIPNVQVTPTWSPPAQPNNNGSQYASGEALAWVNTIGGLVNSLGQTALGYVNQFSGA